MAVVLMMDHSHRENNDTTSCNKEEGGKPILFHDFLGTSCASDSSPVSSSLPPNGNNKKQQQSVGFGSEIRLSEATTSVGASSGGGGNPTVSASSDLGSERQMGSHFEGVPVYGPKSNFSGPEFSNRFAGRKRSISDSVFMGWARDSMPQIGQQDPLENSHLMKMLNRSTTGERHRSSHEEDIFFGMQPPRPTSTSHPILQQPSGSGRPDSLSSKWERSIPISSGPKTHDHRLSQFAAYGDKVSSSRYRDNNAGPSVISQPAADEGSRTGMKGSGILSAINTGSGTYERNATGILLSSSTLKSGAQIAGSEPSNAASRHGSPSVSRQMTIFYAGQAHVFDDVHPNKADVIMALAGANGGSWSTTYSSKSRVRPPQNEAYALKEENGSGIGNLTLPQEVRHKLSIPVNSSSHGLTQGTAISTTAVDTVNILSGDNHSNMTTRDTRTTSQAAEPDNEGGKGAVRG